MSGFGLTLILVAFEQSLQLWSGLTKKGILHTYSQKVIKVKMLTVLLLLVAIFLMSPNGAHSVAFVFSLAGVLSQCTSFVLRCGANDYIPLFKSVWWFNIADVYLVAGVLLTFLGI